MFALSKRLKPKQKFASSFSTAKNTFDVAVIGGGPGGYVAAIKAAQLGLKSVCIEKRPTLGGTCLNVGCIPSKALLNSSHHYHMAKTGLDKYGIEVGKVSLNLGKMQGCKETVVKSLTGGIAMLFRKNKVKWLKGTGKIESPNSIRITDSSGKSEIIEAKNIIIASGSESRSLPGIEIDEKTVVSSTGGLEFKEVPKHLVVIGAGVIGLEIGSVWSRLGAKVTVVEYTPRIAPGLDSEVATDFTKILKKQGFEFKFNTAVESVSKNGAEVSLKLKDAKTGAESQLKCDKVLVAVGRKPYIEGLGLEEAGIKTERGMIKTDGDLKTSVPGVYAIGDVTNGPQLAHKAEEEGIAVAESIAGKASHLNYDSIPGVVYTNPEVANVGKTEDELKKMNVKYKKGKFPFLANSRAKAVNDHEGFVKILADAETDKILGVHIIGEQAGDLIQECVMGLNYGASSEDIARTCHAHPTRGEAVKEAALATFDNAIHF